MFRTNRVVWAKLSLMLEYPSIEHNLRFMYEVSKLGAKSRFSISASQLIRSFERIAVLMEPAVLEKLA